MNCHVCDEFIPNDGESVNVNALQVNFIGGDEWFIRDPKVYYEVLLCHSCVHKMCALVPWIRKLLNPDESHTHTKEYRDAHPVHYGPDYERVADEELGNA